MRVYLSIDLDYWCQGKDPAPFFRRVFKLGLPIFVAPFHDQLLSHIDQSSCDTLINVDYHSDLADFPLGENRDLIDEGTWGCFVRWRATGRFIWRHPSKVHRTDGYCHITNNPFDDPSQAGWRSTEMKEGLVGIPWKQVEAVGVSLSTNWLEEAPVEPIVSRLGINRWMRMSLWDQRRYATPFSYAG
jgi:hypothetical protein